MKADEAGPRLELERLLSRVVDQADEMTAAQERMRELIRINHDLTSRLDLPSILKRIVEIGAQLVRSRYAAIVVVDKDGGLGEFVTVGIDSVEAAGISHLPEGKGLIGALFEHPEAVRLQHIGDDDRSIGFPSGHPPMDSFLGVPIRVGDEVFGNLYLTDSERGEFTADDEEMAQGLASAAGIAIENARLYAEAEHRAKVSESLAELSRVAMRSETEADDVAALVDRAHELLDADLVVAGIVGSRGHEMLVQHASGHGAEGLMSLSFPIEHTAIAIALGRDRPLRLKDVSQHESFGFEEQGDFGAVVLVPFVVGDRPTGLLAIARRLGRGPFQDHDVDAAEAFALQLGVVHERAESRESRRRVTLMEDRERIARDLHDHVIQRLFATGMSLQAAAGKADPAVGELISRQIEEIDVAIGQIRQSIFAIRSSGPRSTTSLRPRVIEIVERLGGQPLRPTVTFVGPVDLLVDNELTDDVVAVSAEGIANAVQHAHATAITLTVAAADGEISVTVQDDGSGIADGSVARGLATLRRRAEARGGRLQVASLPEGGTKLVWSVPS